MCIFTFICTGDIRELFESKIEDDHVISASDECESSSKRFLSYPVSPHLKRIIYSFKLCKAFFHNRKCNWALWYMVKSARPSVYFSVCTQLLLYVVGSCSPVI